MWTRNFNEGRKVTKALRRKGLLDGLASRKFALVLLFALAANFSLSQIPKLEQQAEFFMKVSLFLGALLSLSILFCISRRLTEVLKQIKNPAMFFSSATVRNMPVKGSFYTHTPSAQIEKILHGCFRRRNYRVVSEMGEDALKLSAVKYSFSHLGSVLFHVSFLVIFLGVLCGTLFGMKGYVELVEGQPFEDKHENYAFLSEGRFFNEGHQRFSVLFSQFSPRYYEDGSPQEYRAHLAAGEKHEALKEYDVRVNHPADIHGVRFYYIRHGFAALLKITQDNKEKYEWLAFEERQDRYIRTGRLKSFDLPFHAVFTPNRKVLQGAAHKNEAKDPYLFLQFSDPIKGALKPGEHRYFLGTSVDFVEVRYWTGFSVVHDPGLPVVYFGFALCVLGLILIYFFTPRTFYMCCERAEDGNVLCSIGAKSDKYVLSLPFEFQNVFCDIQQRMKTNESSHEKKREAVAV